MPGTVSAKALSLPFFSLQLECVTSRASFPFHPPPSPFNASSYFCTHIYIDIIRRLPFIMDDPIGLADIFGEVAESLWDFKFPEIMMTPRHSKFLSISAECRALVYEALFQDVTATWCEKFSEPSWGDQSGPALKQVTEEFVLDVEWTLHDETCGPLGRIVGWTDKCNGVLKTCRQIRREAQPILARMCTLRVLFIGEQVPLVNDFPNIFHSLYLKKLENVTLFVPCNDFMLINFNIDLVPNLKRLKIIHPPYEKTHTFLRPQTVERSIKLLQGGLDERLMKKVT